MGERGHGAGLDPGLAPAGSNGVAGNAVVGTLAIDLEAAGHHETAARLELVCLSVSEAGSELFDWALGRRMRGLLQRIGEASLQAAEPGRGPKRPLYRSGFPRRRPVRATHQATVRLDDAAMNLEEAFDLPGGLRAGSPGSSPFKVTLARFSAVQLRRPACG